MRVDGSARGRVYHGRPRRDECTDGVAECWADSIPILLLAGQVNAATLDRECGNYHEIDLEGIFRPVTNWCGTVCRPSKCLRYWARRFRR